MAGIYDLGLQQHKLKMDGKFFENSLIAVAGDSARRLEVQLLDSNNMPQNTTGLRLRLNASVAGQSTYTEAILVNAQEGIYQVDLSNGMLLTPGNWQFQWQVIDSANKKLNSFLFTGTIGSNISEGGTEALNFYVNAEELKQMQDDFLNSAFDSALISAKFEENLNNELNKLEPSATFYKEKVDRLSNIRAVNMSIDDFNLTLKEITDDEDNYDSIFEHPFFSEMKKLHDTYGVIFSLYCFSNSSIDLGNVTTKFKDEFTKNSDWIKFGFHSGGASSNYGISGVDTLKRDYDRFINGLTKFAGLGSLTLTVRLHRYAATLENVLTLRDDYGIKGLFAADDTRLSYDLNQAETNELNRLGYLRKNNLNYYRTDIRLESFSEPAIRNTLNILSDSSRVVIFTHDYSFIESLDKIRNALEWVNVNGYAYNTFDGMFRVDYINNKDEVDLKFTFPTGWSIRSGQTLEVVKKGRDVNVQGQLSKNSNIVFNDVMLSIEGISLPSSVGVRVNVFGSNSDIDHIALVQSSGNLTIGLRRDGFSVPADMRDVILNFSFRLPEGS